MNQGKLMASVFAGRHGAVTSCPAPAFRIERPLALEGA